MIITMVTKLHIPFMIELLTPAYICHESEENNSSVNTSILILLCAFHKQISVKRMLGLRALLINDIAKHKWGNKRTAQKQLFYITECSIIKSTVVKKAHLVNLNGKVDRRGGLIYVA